MSAHKIDFYFNSSDRLRSLALQTRHLGDLQQVFLKTAPQALTQACCVKQLRAGTLTLLAGNAAIAAKLKQLAPRLLTAYEKHGFEITSIRVEAQVNETPPAAALPLQKKRLSIESIKHLEALAARLDDSPLKQALTNLASRRYEDNR
jgi:hypothetical protein